MTAARTSVSRISAQQTGIDRFRNKLLWRVRRLNRFFGMPVCKPTVSLVVIATDNGIARGFPWYLGSVPPANLLANRWWLKIDQSPVTTLIRRYTCGSLSLSLLCLCLCLSYLLSLPPLSLSVIFLGVTRLATASHVFLCSTF